MGGYVCQQCRVWRYPDCEYRFHPTPPEEVPDRWREAADEAGRPDDVDAWKSPPTP